MRQACFKRRVNSQSDGFLGPLWTSTSFGDFRYEDTARRMRRKGVSGKTKSMFSGISSTHE